MFRSVVAAVLFGLGCWAVAQEESVQPGISDPSKAPDVKDAQGKFEGESREVNAKRDKILAGFEKSDEVKEPLKESDFVVFTKPAGSQPGPKGKAVTPVVEGYGPVVPIPDAAEAPAKGSKVVFDVTGTGKDATQPLPGLVRAATLLNLAGASGLKASDLEIVVVLHGDATSAALDDAAYKELTGREHPHADVIKKLKGAGVKVLVYGQALARKGYDPKRVRGEVSIAASAVSAVVNLQTRGFAYVPAP